MKDNEINEAIAKACGWTSKTRRSTSGDCYALWLKNDKPANVLPPNYCTDLNAMHEAIATLSPFSYDGEDGFTNWLAFVTQGKRAPTTGWLFRPMQEATARQRAEAFLRTLNLWREE